MDVRAIALCHARIRATACSAGIKLPGKKTGNRRRRYYSRNSGTESDSDAYDSAASSDSSVIVLKSRDRMPRARTRSGSLCPKRTSTPSPPPVDIPPRVDGVYDGSLEGNPNPFSGKKGIEGDINRPRSISTKVSFLVVSVGAVANSK